jgi:PadR family transcriptional regulator, regulatory protein PadR
MRRKEGALVPLEVSILEVAMDLSGRGTPEAHGFLLARELRDREGARRLTGYGTLYKALERLEGRGYMASRWEDPNAAAEEGRPRRRFYRVTAIGEGVARDAIEARDRDRRRGVAAVSPA